jgi:hypothetical protein
MPTLNVPLRKQQKTHWCWVAVSLAVVDFYEGISFWNQGKLINEIKRGPRYQAKMRELIKTPGTLKEEYINFPGDVEDSLRMIQCFESRVNVPLSCTEVQMKDFAARTFADVKQQINTGRPIVCGIKPRGSDAEGHIVMIVGYDGDSIIWREPGHPEEIRISPSFYEFVVSTGGVGYLKYMIYTKPSSENLNDPTLIYTVKPART